MKNNIYITNFWWVANYGAILTAFALNKLIDGSYLIDNKEFKQKLFESKFSFHTNFEKKYLKTKSKPTELSAEENTIFITGSDQVFRPCLNPRISSDNFLDFVKPNCKKIAFSASFGVDKETFVKENSQEEIKGMKNSLQSFDLISVREKSGVEICRDILGLDAEWIIDPVFVLEKSKYDELIKNASKDYSGKVVSYMINSNIENYNGEKTTELFASDEPVENWLNAIKTCKLLITNSYHGVCFAIIFNKPFICITNSETGSTRYDSLFEMLEINNQIIKSTDELKGEENIFDINYEKVNERIKKERQRGIDYLKKVLEISPSHIQEKTEVMISYLDKSVKELQRQNNLKYQVKKFLCEKWLIIYYKYLPEPVKGIIRMFKNIVRRF